MKSINPTTFLLCLLLFSSAAWGQNFHPFPGNEFLYGYRSAQQDSFQRLITIESRYALGNDSIYLFNRGVYDNGFKFTANYDNVPGRGVRLHANGDMTFFTSANDSFFIPVGIAVGDTFAYTTGVTGTLIQSNMAMVFGQMDFIQRYDLGNNVTARLSAQFGWLELPVVVPQKNSYPAQVQLEGIQDRQLGARQPTLLEYFTWQVGDSMQYLEFDSYNEQGPPPSRDYIYADMKVLDRTLQDDTLILTRERFRFGKKETVNFPNVTTFFIPQTLDTIVDTFPGVLVQELWNINDPVQERYDVDLPAGSSDNNFIRLEMKVDSLGRRSYKAYPLEGFLVQTPPVYDMYQAFSSSVELREGVGQIRHHADDNNTGYEYSLVCYHKVGQAPVGSCEDPENYLVARVEPVVLDVQIYPNPFSETLKIEILKPATAQIFDLSGRVLYSDIQLTPGQNVIPLPELPAGSYFLRLTASDGATSVRKLVKRAE